MAEQDKVVVVIAFEKMVDGYFMCERQANLAKVRQLWQQDSCSTDRSSVAFLAPDGCVLSDDVTIGEILRAPGDKSVDLRAVQKSTYRLQVFGRECSRTEFQVVASRTPADVRCQIKGALGIETDDFRLTLDGAELNEKLTFAEQDVQEGAQIMLDLQVTVKVRFDEHKTDTVTCFSSDSVLDLHKQLQCDEDTVLTAISPTWRVLSDHVQICHVVSHLRGLEKSIDMAVERKSEFVYKTFELICPEPLTKQLPVTMTNTPFEIYDMVSENFQLKTDFRFTICGQELNYHEPLLSQLSDTSDVIQVDVLRPCLVRDLWENQVKKIDLFSSENLKPLHRGPDLSDQRLCNAGVDFPTEGRMMDIIGSIHNQPVLRIDRDVKRNLPHLTPEGIEKRGAWAADKLLNVAPSSRSRPPKEIMFQGELISAERHLHDLPLTDETVTITDPEKVFVSTGKKLRICRFAHGSTYGDVREKLQQLKGSRDVRLKVQKRQIAKEELHRELDHEQPHLICDKQLPTKVTVTSGGRKFLCSFAASEVSFSDVIADVSRQVLEEKEAKKKEEQMNVNEIRDLPRRLFAEILYCGGCGRRVAKEEEEFQAIPARCCRVKSLDLTDRRFKDAGIQTATSRGHDESTCTDVPEQRDIATSPPSPSTWCIHARSLDVEEAESTSVVTVEDCTNFGTLLGAADRELKTIPSPGVFTQTVLYDRGGEEREAMRCFNEGGTPTLPFIDVLDGQVAPREAWRQVSYRFLRPSSLLPTSSILPPYVVIETEVDRYEVTPRRKLQPAPPDAFFDPEYVVAMRGIKSASKRGVFWELNDAPPMDRAVSFVNSWTGKVFEKEKIPGEAKRYVFALMRAGRPVPRAKVSKGTIFLTFARAGLHLRMERGCVRCDEPQAEETEKWHILPKKQPFVQALAQEVTL